MKKRIRQRYQIKSIYNGFFKRGVQKIDKERINSKLLDSTDTIAKHAPRVRRVILVNYPALKSITQQHLHGISLFLQIYSWKHNKCGLYKIIYNI